SVEMLRPDVYIKGGDYTVERLSSRRIVESYGGKVVLTSHIPMQSTTAIIDKIMQRVEPEVRTTSIDIDPYDSRPAVFLDRDGTINEHVDYLHQPERYRILPGALEAIREMREAGFRIVVITNQPGIGTGYFSKDDFFKVNKKLLEEASARGVAFDRIFFCPHSKGDNCNCRKPKPAMIERAIRELNIDRRGSFVIGDMTSDIEAARRAGIKSILVKTGRGGTDQLYDVVPDYIVSDLQSAAEIVTLNQYSRSVELLPAEI
ncbi:MAG: D-glycero-beta-D-manno-heptose 1,7-bisphosphate 7-phosphatase, partial [Deltaproteobacteria bacterium]|nr:D-glycero-beta-D-manno-heptose 1,7-bisphosphate 7-phosphatase [Deltaproteobacteria bacterium]